MDHGNALGSFLAISIAGLLVSLWPAALVAIVVGDSEPCAGAIMALGTALLMLVEDASG